MTPTRETQDTRLAGWLAIGQDNPWIRCASDPPFTARSFAPCSSVTELQGRIGHGNWTLGQAFHLADLCFINQVDGGDEWLTIRSDITGKPFAFESITFGPMIARGEFAEFIGRLNAATDEQCRTLAY